MNFIAKIRIGKWNDQKKGYADDVLVKEYDSEELAEFLWKHQIEDLIDKEAEDEKGRVRRFSYELAVNNKSRIFGYSNYRLQF